MILEVKPSHGLSLKLMPTFNSQCCGIETSVISKRKEAVWDANTCRDSCSSLEGELVISGVECDVIKPGISAHFSLLHMLVSIIHREVLSRSQADIDIMLLNLQNHELNKVLSLTTYSVQNILL